MTDEEIEAIAAERSEAYDHLQSLIVYFQDIDTASRVKLDVATARAKARVGAAVAKYDHMIAQLAADKSYKGE